MMNWYGNFIMNSLIKRDNEAKVKPIKLSDMLGGLD